MFDQRDGVSVVGHYPGAQLIGAGRTTLKYSLLGPLEVSHHGERIQIGGQRQQIILATLLLEAGHIVPVNRLIESIWDTAPPATAREQVQNCLGDVRRRLLGIEPDRPFIETRPPGYAIVVDEADLDCHVMQRHLAHGHTASAEQRWPAAVEHLRAALGLWRGSTLDGLPNRIVRAAAARFDERRLTTYEECLDLELRLGRHHTLIGELTSLVMEHPMREGFVSRLMLALHRAGRRVEALDLYLRTRQLYVDELGLEPGEALRKLQQAILVSDPSLSAPVKERAQVKAAARQAPCLLPPLVGDFVGREQELATLTRELRKPAGDRNPVVVVSGRLGMGKTALALQAAHALAPHFLDGVIYLDLRAGGSCLEPAEALGRLMRALGVASGDSFDECVEAFRLAVASRRLLLVLDDAPALGDLRHLLPGSGPSAAIVVSRSTLPELGGAVRLELGPLETDRSAQLLAAPSRRSFLPNEYAAVQDVVALCGRLPLAIHGCGLRLAAKPHWTVGALRAKLTDDRARLDLVSCGPGGLRESLDCVYRTLGADVRLVLRRMSLFAGAQVGPGTVAALCETTADRAEQALELLADVGFVEPVVRADGELAFVLEELTALYARERLLDESTGDVEVGRLERSARSLRRERHPEPAAPAVETREPRRSRIGARTLMPC